MKILFISPYVIERNCYGGMKRLARFAKFLQTRHSVFAICLNIRTHQGHEVQYQLERTQIFNRPLHSPMRRVLNYCFQSTPSYVFSTYSPAMADCLRDCVEREQIDLVHIEYAFMGQYVQVLGELPCAKVLVDQELSFRRLRRELEVRSHPSQWIRHYLTYPKIRRFETSICRHFDRVFTITEEERSSLLSEDAGLHNIELFPHVVDTQYFAPLSDEKEEPDSLAFVGDFTHLPNETGILWFCREVWPEIRRHRPACRLMIIGSCPSVRVQALAQLPGVQITGQVPDVRPYVARAAICLNPVITGGGMRGKVLEAMAMGKVIVSTLIGAEGFQAAHAWGFPTASTGATFASTVVELLASPEKRNALGRLGRKFVVNNHDEGVVFTRMEQRYLELIGQRDQSSVSGACP